MRAVIVSSNVCYPLTAGNRIRMYHLMVRLARHHEITFICRGGADAAEERRCQEHLAEHNIETRIVPDPIPRKSGLRFGVQLAANLLSPLPYSVTLHNSAALRRAIVEHVAQHGADVIQCEWFPHAWGLRRETGVPTIVSAHDVVSVLWQLHHETEKNPLKQWYIRQQWRKFERLERQVYADVSRVVAVSPVDAALLRSKFGVEHVDVVDNGVDHDYFAAVQPARVVRRILFLGTLESRPNLDGVRWLLDDIFPRVKAAEPSAQLCVVGRNPPTWLLSRAAALPGIEVHANVVDVRPFLAGSGLMVVPLRIGGGSRIKILEALATGLPVVSTGVGAEGLSLTAGEHYAQADSAEAMADALVESIRNPARVQAQAERGRQVVLQRYDWDALAERLGEVWERCVVTGTPTDGHPWASDAA